MIKILLCGCFGRMGRAVISAAEESNGKFSVISGADINALESCFPVYEDIRNATEVPDVIIDFSHHTALPAILEYATAKNIPTIVCTTGHTDEEKAMMKDAAKKIPVFHSGNMSLGINLLIALCKKASDILGIEYDVEIIEQHHHNKLDAPSGTALMIANAIADTRETSEYVYDRHEVRRKRSPDEIGIHAVRGGSIIGEHEVLFAGKDEVIKISHSASSRELFATGALRAAEFIVGKDAGFYDMNNVIGSID